MKKFEPHSLLPLSVQLNLRTAAEASRHERTRAIDKAVNKARLTYPGKFRPDAKPIDDGFDPDEPYVTTTKEQFYG